MGKAYSAAARRLAIGFFATLEAVGQAAASTRIGRDAKPAPG